jgi:hypothetical protein
MRAFPLLLALLLALPLGPALAQPAAAPEPATTEAPAAASADDTATPAASATLDERGWPTGPDAAEVADAAVAAWLVREPLAVADLTAMTPSEACLRLPDLVSAPPPPRGTRVITEDRRAVPAAVPDDDRAAFTYAAVRPTDALDVVQVDLVRVDDTWQVQRVGFRAATGLTGVRAWLQTPPASIAFVLFTLLVVLGLVRPSPLRRALAFGLRTARAHRTTIVVTMVLLYAVFGLGALSGAALPPECDLAIMTVLETAIGQLGATAAYGSGDIARAAVVTFYQNFIVVTFSVHFFLVLLFGIPSYLVAIPQFFLLGIPFGLLGGTTFFGLVPVLVLLVLELTAYFLVVSGGGVVLGTLFRRGFTAYPQAVRGAASLLVPAGLLLLIGAWYEAILLIAAGF